MKYGLKFGPPSHLFDQVYRPNEGLASIIFKYEMRPSIFYRNESFILLPALFSLRFKTMFKYMATMLFFVICVPISSCKEV